MLLLLLLTALSRPQALVSEPIWSDPLANHSRWRAVSNRTSCPLTPISHLLELASFMGSDQSLLAMHFVRHYHRHVGVPLMRMRFWVHGSPNATGVTQEAVATLVAEGVDARNITVETGRWSDKMMLQAINLHISTLPKSHYLIYANIDEFYYYPCDLQLRIAAGQQLFCLCMQDRMAANGKVTAIAKAPAIELQYPHACYVRSLSLIHI